MTLIYSNTNLVVDCLKPDNYSIKWDIFHFSYPKPLHDTFEMHGYRVKLIRFFNKPDRCVNIILSVNKGCIENFSLMDHMGVPLISDDKPVYGTLYYQGVIRSNMKIGYEDGCNLCGNFTIRDYDYQNNKHKQKILNDFVQLFKDQKYTDITFKFKDGKEIQAHKSVLAARSDVFDAMFKKDMKEANENCVNIEDIESDIFEKMLSYIYTAEIQNLDENAKNLLYIAEKYNLQDLKDMCENYMIFDISLANATSSLIAADMYGLNNLRAKSIEFLTSKAVDFIQTEDFIYLKKKYPDLLSELFVSVAHKTKKMKMYD